MRNNLIIGTCAGLVTSVALGVILSSHTAWPPRIDARPHLLAGQLLGQEALRRLGDGGELMVITRDSSDFRQPAMDLLLASLKRVVTRAGARIAAVRALEVDPLRLIEVPSGDFMELIGKAGAGSVIVSLMGPPLFTPEQRLQLGHIRPKIIAFCPGNQPAQIDLRQVFAQHSLDVAVVTRRPRPSGNAPLSRGGSTEVFQVITVTNVDALYALPDAARSPESP